jgi:hypothetical protein
MLSVGPGAHRFSPAQNIHLRMSAGYTSLVITGSHIAGAGLAEGVKSRAPACKPPEATVTHTSGFPYSYGPELLRALEQAFDAVWATLCHMPLACDQAKELKVALSQTLIALAADGITEPQELRRKALENMALTSSR